MPWAQSLPASIDLTNQIAHSAFPALSKGSIHARKRCDRECASRYARGQITPTQAGEFVRDEIEHVRQGKYGVRSPKQAIAIGLSKARRAGISLPPPKAYQSSRKVRRQAERDLSKGRRRDRKPSAKRSRATSSALRQESRSSVSHAALSRQAKSSARKRGAESRRRSARTAVRTKGRAGRQGPTVKRT